MRVVCSLVLFRPTVLHAFLPTTRFKSRFKNLICRGCYHDWAAYRLRKSETTKSKNKVSRCRWTSRYNIQYGPKGQRQARLLLNVVPFFSINIILDSLLILIKDTRTKLVWLDDDALGPSYHWYSRSVTNLYQILRRQIERVSTSQKYNWPQT